MNYLGPEKSIRSVHSASQLKRRPSSLHPLLGAIKDEQSVEAPQIAPQERRSSAPPDTLINPDEVGVAEKTAAEIKKEKHQAKTANFLSKSGGIVSGAAIAEQQAVAVPLRDRAASSGHITFFKETSSISIQEREEEDHVVVEALENIELAEADGKPLVVPKVPSLFTPGPSAPIVTVLTYADKERSLQYDNYHGLQVVEETSKMQPLPKGKKKGKFRRLFMTKKQKEKEDEKLISVDTESTMTTKQKNIGVFCVESWMPSTGGTMKIEFRLRKRTLKSMRKYSG